MRIERKSLDFYEGTRLYVAQRKFNGTHAVLAIKGEDIAIWDRRGIALTLYQLTPAMRHCLLNLRRDPAKETILCGELLHTKAKSKITNQQEATDTIVLFDVLVYDDVYLTQINQMERLHLLAEICGRPQQLEGPKAFGATSRALVVEDYQTAHLWLAQVFPDDFLYHFDEMCTGQKDRHGRDKYSEIEGLILRRRDSRLVFKKNGIGDVDWLIRVRKPKPKVYTI